MVRKLVTKAKKWTWSVASRNKETKVLRRPVVGCVVVSACFGSYWHPKIRYYFRRQIQKNHREGGSSAELVARDATGHLNKIRRSSAIATTAIHKTIHKNFCLPSKSHFYNLPISSSGDCFTRRIFSYTLQKVGAIGAECSTH